jgi:hypothetical protein
MSFIIIIISSSSYCMNDSDEAKDYKSILNDLFDQFMHEYKNENITRYLKYSDEIISQLKNINPDERYDYLITFVHKALDKKNEYLSNSLIHELFFYRDYFKGKENENFTLMQYETILRKYELTFGNPYENSSHTTTENVKGSTGSNPDRLKKKRRLNKSKKKSEKKEKKKGEENESEGEAGQIDQEFAQIFFESVASFLDDYGAFRIAVDSFLDTHVSKDRTRRISFIKNCSDLIKDFPELTEKLKEYLVGDQSSVSGNNTWLAAHESMIPHRRYLKQGLENGLHNTSQDSSMRNVSTLHSLKPEKEWAHPLKIKGCCYAYCVSGSLFFGGTKNKLFMFSLQDRKVARTYESETTPSFPVFITKYNVDEIPTLKKEVIVNPETFEEISVFWSNAQPSKSLLMENYYVRVNDEVLEVYNLIDKTWFGLEEKKKDITTLFDLGNGNLLVGSLDGIIKKFDLRQKKSLMSMSMEAPVKGLSLINNILYGVIGNGLYMLTLHEDQSSYHPVYVAEDSEGEITCLSTGSSPNVYLGFLNGKVREFKDVIMQKSTLVKELKLGEPVRAIYAHRDDIVVHGDKTLKLLYKEIKPGGQ